MGQERRNFWNRMSSYYDIFMKKDQKLYDEIANRITSMVNPEDKILEIGTATGIISLLLANKLQEVEAIDYSDNMIKIARNKAEKLDIKNVQFKVGNAYDLKYKDNTFDSIIIANVLHIMPDPEKAISEIKRVLKKDGKLFAPTFTHANSKKARLFSKVASLIGFKAYSKWSSATYEDFLEINGLKVIHLHVIKASFSVAYVVCKVKE